MKKLQIAFVTVLMLCFIAYAASVPNYVTLPQLTKLDRVLSLNQSGNNLTADYFIGDGSKLTGITSGTTSSGGNNTLIIADVCGGANCETFIEVAGYE